MGLQIFFAVIFILVVVVIRRMRASWDIDTEEYIPVDSPYVYGTDNDDNDYGFTKVEGKGIDDIPFASSVNYTSFSPEVLAKYENIDSQYVPIDVMAEEVVFKTEPHKDLQDFSLRRAMIYSEILKPKYINY